MANPAARLPIPSAVAAAIGAVVLLALCSFQLPITDVAVVTTLGRPSVITRPGLHWRWPWPVQRVVRFDRRKQVLQLPARDTTTGDRMNLIIRTFAVWRIEDPLLFSNSLGTRYEAEAQLKSLVESAQEATFRSHSLADFVAAKGGTPTLPAVEDELLTAVRDTAKGNYGIDIELVGIAQLSLHESNTGSVLSRMQQEQSRRASEIESAARKEAKIIRDDAASRKAQKVAEAEADAKRVRGEAMIKATEQYETFKQDPEFAMFLRKLDALETTTETRTTVILDPKTPPFDLLKAPSTVPPATVRPDDH